MKKDEIKAKEKHKNKKDECVCHEECKCDDNKKEIEELKNKVMLVQAELINYRKRTEEQKEELIKYANKDLLFDLTDMIDNLDRALKVKSDNKEVNNMLIGIKMINDQFNDILTNYGVKKIDALGNKFDSNYMEAIETVNDKDKEDEIVTKVLRDGYLYKDKVLKHAQVIVNKIK